MKRPLLTFCTWLGVAGAGVLGFSVAPSSADPGAFAFKEVEASPSTTQAGAHPNLRISFVMTKDAAEKPNGLLRELSIGLPPGLIGNPTNFPHCTNAQLANSATVFGLSEEGCPQDSQVGITEVEIYDTRAGGSGTLKEPVYLMEAPGGDTDTAARLGFVALFFPTVINVGVRSDSDYGITSSLEGLSSIKSVTGSTTTLWGIPADPSHDGDRITPFESAECDGKPCTAPGELPRRSGLLPRPFMTNPTHCTTGDQVSFAANSYAEPARTVVAAAPFPTMTGCASLKFEPKLTVTPTSHQAGAPTGLDVSLQLPQDEAVGSRATAQLRNATVTLPPGMSIASGAGDGLEACSAAQVGFQRIETAHCPNGAKIGSADFDVPVLEHVLHGAIYQRTPEPGNLFRIWLVSDELGVHLKIPGEIKANPITGQITSIFIDTPQAPTREIQLHFFGGPRAPLANPPTCGTFQTQYEFTPWSGTAPVRGTSPMVINESCNGGGFSPTLSGGSVNPVAGHFSSFVLNLGRADREQNISGLSVTLPLGLLAKPAGIPLCPTSAAASGNCSPASQIGSVAVAAGPGSNPLWIPQPGKAPTVVYLSGPYEGAPYSLVVKVPAQAGPFDLGTVVTRAAIFVDQSTAQVSVKSDPLPQILEGVPVLYRNVRVTVDRPNFMLNPTSCEKKSIAARVTSSTGTVANPTARYQVGDCANLDYKPDLKLKLTGPTKRSGHPALKAVITTPKKGSFANTKSIQVGLPHAEFLDQGNLDKVCTQPQLRSATCPKGSVYGHVKVWTPLFDRPLEGSVYIGVGFGHTLPDLVTELNGQVRILLHGRIDTTKHEGIRTSFETVPDAPFSRVVLEMKGGKKYGLLENSENICRKTQRASASFGAQNGATLHLTPLIANSCKKKKSSR